VPTLQAQPPVVSIPITHHQRIGQPLGFGAVQAAPYELANPCGESVNLG